VLDGFDGGQVAEDDGALLVIGAGRVVQRGGEGFLRLREVPGFPQVNPRKTERFAGNETPAW
jgi:hypothetical protein